MQKYILWDLDGTIVNSEDPAFKGHIFETACRKTGMVFNLSEQQYIGHTGKEVYKSVLQSNGIYDYANLEDGFNIWEDHAVRCLKENIAKVLPRDNVVDLWNYFHEIGIRQAVVTSSYEDIAIQYLKNIKIYEKCVSITSLDQVTRPKPDPEPYQLAMRNLGTEPSFCIAIEDSLSGICSAKSAGIYTIAWLTEGGDHRVEIADEVTTKLSTEMILKGWL
ncbi:HAD-IA family hydrolase [Elizabethkingia argentiflava]|uniref:HAD-IA family hydrolase n=1 Tax=Elizabethkingia argenteiflava TaxID=2681556 RepID=A0A845PXU1_9FLAO|nr:HAD-IA family hydrolase [Elizabethkingia argenteiflava]NAW51751.1 HAD-IA family hydrolase [Elizabethkingia argenteiflava]